MTNSYGESKQRIKRSRIHIANIVSLLGPIEGEYVEYQSIQTWFKINKPFLTLFDESMIDLLLLITNPGETNYGENSSESSNEND